MIVVPKGEQPNGERKSEYAKEDTNMRKEAKKILTTNDAHIQGYHANTYWAGNSQSYAFAGFQKNLWFNSDRYEELVRLDNGCCVRKDKDGNLLPMHTFGVEIETECNSIHNPEVLAEVMDKIIFPNFKFGSKMWKMQHDGSLGGYTSVEVISQPMTKGRIRNDYAAYQTMFDKYFKSFEIDANAYETHCGMHINIANDIFGKTKAVQDEAIRKFYYVINRHHNFFCKLFYRPANRTNWCRQMTAEHLRYAEGWNLEHAQRYDWHNAKNIDLEGHVPADHSNCVNLSHYKAGRIELRIPGGQDSYVRFRNTMECAFFLTENIRKVKWDDLDDLAKVFKGCNNYVCKRLRDCIGVGGFTAMQFMDIEHNATHDDFEIRA